MRGSARRCWPGLSGVGAPGESSWGCSSGGASHTVVRTAHRTTACWDAGSSTPGRSPWTHGAPDDTVGPVTSDSETLPLHVVGEFLRELTATMLLGSAEGAIMLRESVQDAARAFGVAAEVLVLTEQVALTVAKDQERVTYVVRENRRSPGWISPPRSSRSCATSAPDASRSGRHRRGCTRSAPAHVRGGGGEPSASSCSQPASRRACRLGGPRSATRSS